MKLEGKSGTYCGEVEIESMLPQGCGAFSFHDRFWIFGHFEKGTIGEGNCVKIEKVGDVYRASCCFVWRAMNGGFYEKGVKVDNEEIISGLWLDGVWQNEVELRDNSDILGFFSSGRFTIIDENTRIFGELDADGEGLKRGISIYSNGDIFMSGNFTQVGGKVVCHFIELWTKNSKKGTEASYFNLNVGVCYSGNNMFGEKKYTKFYPDGETEEYDIK